MSKMVFHLLQEKGIMFALNSRPKQFMKMQMWMVMGTSNHIP